MVLVPVTLKGFLLGTAAHYMFPVEASVAQLRRMQLICAGVSNQLTKDGR